MAKTTKKAKKVTATTDCPSCGGKGRLRYAFTAVLLPSPIHGRDDIKYGFTLGIAHENLSGYTPDPFRRIFQHFKDAENIASALNADMGLTTEDAAKIVLGSMRKQQQFDEGRG